MVFPAKVKTARGWLCACRDGSMHSSPAPANTAPAWGHQPLLTETVTFPLVTLLPPVSFPVAEGLHVPVSSRALQSLELVWQCPAQHWWNWGFSGVHS